MPNFFDEVNKTFDEAATFTDYPKGLLDQIRCCNSVYRFDFPLRRTMAPSRSFTPGAPNTATTSCR